MEPIIVNNTTIYGMVAQSTRECIRSGLENGRYIFWAIHW